MDKKEDHFSKMVRFTYSLPAYPFTVHQNKLLFSGRLKKQRRDLR